MGGSSFSTDFYEERARARAATNTPVFKHDEDVRTGKVSTALHEALDPSKLKGGVREARDSAAHPNSVPILFMLDVTGSMSSVPKIVQSKLGKLMTTILTKGYLADPQILFAAIGDANSDKVPLQVGQFESGLEMEDDLSRFFLEGGGGGQSPPTESYELGFLFAARHTVSDAWEKRNKKGYLFMTGDERAYPEATPHAIHKAFGGERPATGISTETLIAECKERYHVFFLIPGGTSHGNSPALRAYWDGLIGAENVLRMEDANDVCNIVADTIGRMEGAAVPKPLTTPADPAPAATPADPDAAATKARVDAAKATGAKTARL